MGRIMMGFEDKSEKILHLVTANGEITVPAFIEYHTQEEELTDDNATSMTVYIDYNGKTIKGVGTKYPFMDAFVDLKKKLPTSVDIKGCVNCRHGNMCPVGNMLFEVFCTKDVVITHPRDLWNYTESETEISKRSREYTQVCGL